MEKIIKSRLFFFLLGALVSITITVLAYSYNASDVGYTPTENDWDVENNSGALDDLYYRLHYCDRSN